MMAPLMDSKGNVRYFIGSQVDVSGLARDCTDLPALKRLLAKAMEGEDGDPKEEEKDEFQALSEMFNQNEIETVRKTGGRMHREQVEEDESASIYHQPRLLLKDSPPLGSYSEVFGKVRNNGKLAGIYSHVSQHPRSSSISHTNVDTSISSSVRTRPFAFCSPPRPSGYLEFSNPPL